MTLTLPAAAPGVDDLSKQEDFTQGGPGINEVLELVRHGVYGTLLSGMLPPRTAHDEGLILNYVLCHAPGQKWNPDNQIGDGVSYIELRIFLLLNELGKAPSNQTFTEYLQNSSLDLDLAKKLSPQGLRFYVTTELRENFSWPEDVQKVKNWIEELNKENGTDLQTEYDPVEIIEALAAVEDQGQLDKGTMPNPRLVVVPKGYCLDHSRSFLKQGSDRAYDPETGEHNDDPYIDPDHYKAARLLEETQFAILNVGSTEAMTTQPKTVYEQQSSATNNGIRKQDLRDKGEGWGCDEYSYNAAAAMLEYERKNAPADQRNQIPRMDTGTGYTIFPNIRYEGDPNRVAVGRCFGARFQFSTYVSTDVSDTARLRAAVVAKKLDPLNLGLGEEK